MFFGSSMTNGSTFFDALVVGGGAAGLSAALALGRATRHVLLATDGPTRNAPSHAAHNVFTRDGTPPADLIRVGLGQLAPYDVTVRNERVSDAERTADGFVVTFASGDRIRTRGLVLAIGVRDVLPETPGFRELWGTGVFHCPYCHGWEVAGRPLALYGQGEKALHLSRLIRGWSRDLVLFTDGPSELSDEDRNRIEQNGIVVREERVERLLGSHDLDGVVLEGGEVVARAGLFLSPKQELRSDLPHRLGCAITADGRVEADSVGRTAVPKLFVAGDAGPNPQSVSVAASSGMLAGVFLNHELLADEFAGHAVSSAAP